MGALFARNNKIGKRTKKGTTPEGVVPRVSIGLGPEFDGVDHYSSSARYG